MTLLKSAAAFAATLLFSATAVHAATTVTIGTHVVTIWAEQVWLVALDNPPEDYDVDDLLK